MIARYRLLARRIELEIEELERIQATIQRHWQTARRTATDQDAYLSPYAARAFSGKRRRSSSRRSGAKSEVSR